MLRVWLSLDNLVSRKYNSTKLVQLILWRIQTKKLLLHLNMLKIMDGALSKVERTPGGR